MRCVPGNRSPSLATRARVGFERPAIAVTDLSAPFLLDLVREPGALERGSDAEVVIEIIARRGTGVTVTELGRRAARFTKDERQTRLTLDLSDSLDLRRFRQADELQLVARLSGEGGEPFDELQRDAP
jgi:hypothetical protein